MVGVLGNMRNYIKGSQRYGILRITGLEEQGGLGLQDAEDWILRRVRFLMFRPAVLQSRDSTECVYLWAVLTLLGNVF